ncbi:hypothetical protein CASFOL_017451 [Castilleja foliolosa]|uniref:Helitron helicase-like domain-containing protein n=1 Tax=Castilleja foliolosa TaxID=1961234 RepID=A0ABD3DEG0_9LAMI
MSSICPPGNEGPRFLQLYIYDTINEVSNRLRFFDSSQTCSLSPAVVTSLTDTLNSCNEFVRLFRSAADLCDTSAICDFSVRLYNNVGDRRYEPPASGTLGGIVFAEDYNASDYDIVVHNKDGPPHRVSKLHPSYIPLQYPLLFPYAEPGWSPQLRLHSVWDGRKKNLTVNMYYSFQIHDRDGVYSLLLNGGRLFQQYLVDAYTCIEQSRLDFINSRVTTMLTILVNASLPSSFTGGPRYMYKYYQDALAICRVYGNPQYFITFTCNVKWPEISRHIQKIGGTQPQNRPDIIARVFQIKVQQFLRFMRSNKTFGDVAAELYTIEFQKRGLPHCHTLLWVRAPYKVREAADVDKYVSAEIRDPSTNPALHKIVTDLMIHGPCGLARPTSPCMRDNTCSKSFPKKFECSSRFDKDGYVHYRRRDTPQRATKNGVALDNRYVVPYNEHLCRHFNAHINIEHCGWSMMIKYLFKYVSKGADRVRFCITRSDEAGSVDPHTTNPVVNVIKNFVDGRYICPHEASWRILNFPIHERTPAVEVLAVHLQDMQNVTFKENLKLQAIVRNPSFGKTTTAPDFFVNDSEIQQSILFELEKLLNSGNRLLMEETCYDRASLAADHSRSHLLLNSDQKQGRYDLKMHTTTTQMACQRIRDITERQMPLTIEIRVLRKWISKGKKEESCYQFVDIHGDGIEATADVKHIEYFDSVINLQSCYRVSGYICTGRRTYMTTVDHPASLAIGQKAKFHPVTNLNIPTIYFNFATYEKIKTRIKDAKLLTDRACTQKLTVVYEHRKTAKENTCTGSNGREVEITLWPEMRHLIGDDVIPGHIVAITSTMHGSRNFTCEAIIKEIHEERGWYYVLCSKCSSKLYPQQDSGRLNFVCKDDDDITPNFRYSVNATIMDATGSADAIFFNDSMQAMINISCEDMVTKYADKTNPRVVPQLLRSTIGTPKVLHLTLKNDGKIAVNNVSEVASGASSQLTGNVPGTSTFTPTTPLPKSATSKRQLEDLPGPTG